MCNISTDEREDPDGGNADEIVSLCGGTRHDSRKFW
jgi:hypothetical protein